LNIKVHIERLILDGVPIRPVELGALQDSVEQELTRLLAMGGLRPALASSKSLHTVPAAEIHVANDVTAVGLGNQIATAVHSRIGPIQPKVRNS
jgi:hypothetical protein